MPCFPSSEPIPLHLCPPIVAAGLASRCEFTQTEPASSCLAIRSACSKSFDQTEAPSPILVSFARAITSSSVFQERRGTIGPGGVSNELRGVEVHTERFFQDK